MRPMKHGCLRSLLTNYVVLLLGLSFSFSVWSAQLEGMNFYQNGEVSHLELALSDAEVKVKKFHITEDKQIIIDLKDVEATERVMRAFDTSEFSGGVVFVSAYKKPGNESDMRITLQLRDNV